MGDKTGMFAFTTRLFEIVLEVLATAITQKEVVKGIQVGKEEVKLSLFADDMILYIENLKTSNKKLLELINKFCKVAGYNISIQKSLAFLYNNNELLGKETKKSLLQLHQKIKYLGINLIKDVKNLYLKNSKILKKETEDDTNEWKYIVHSGTGRINIIKMPISK